MSEFHDSDINKGLDHVCPAVQSRQNDKDLKLQNTVDKILDNILIIEMLLKNNLLVTPERLGEIIDQFVSLIEQIKINVEFERYEILFRRCRKSIKIDCS